MSYDVVMNKEMKETFKLRLELENYLLEYIPYEMHYDQILKECLPLTRMTFDSSNAPMSNFEGLCSILMHKMKIDPKELKASLLLAVIYDHVELNIHKINNDADPAFDRFYQTFQRRVSKATEGLEVDTKMCIDPQGEIVIEGENLQTTLRQVILLDMLIKLGVLEDDGNDLVFNLQYTDEGLRHYLFLSSLDLDKRITETIQKIEITDSEVNEAKQSSEKLLTDSRKLIRNNRLMQKKLYNIESNLFLYMSVFIAVFSLLGINFSYVAGLIELHSMLGVVILNGSVVIAITVIFVLVDIMRSGNQSEDADEYEKMIKAKRSSYALVIITELVITGMFLLGDQLIH
jgi:hypothetical protein